MAKASVARLTRNAMGTRFELVLVGERERFLRGMGEEALDEIARLEAQLSFYRMDSDINDLNTWAAQGPVKVEPRLFRLLERAGELSAATEGAFDITVAPLMRCWGFAGGAGALPTEEAIAEALEKVGMQRVLLDAENSTVRFDREGVQLDLGSIGKGYAIDQAIEFLRDNGIENALLHGGTSSVYALGRPSPRRFWKVAIHDPLSDDPKRNLATVKLRDSALSVSAPHGKWFESNGRRYGHVLDPRTGYPTGRSRLAALVTDNATDGDALSTALLTLGSDWLPTLARQWPQSGALLAWEDAEGVLRIAGERWSQAGGELRLTPDTETDII